MCIHSFVHSRDHRFQTSGLEVTTGDNVPLEATATVNWVIEASPWGWVLAFVL